MFRRKKLIELTAPAGGTVITLDEVPDPVFARRSLGDGCAILPTDGDFRSPVDGEIVMLAPTGHAFGVRSDDGVEVLVHIGMDTVKLRGAGFTVHGTVGQRVRRGDLVVRADLAAMTGVVPSLASPVVVTNGAAFEVAEVLTGPVGKEPVLRLRAR